MGRAVLTVAMARLYATAVPVVATPRPSPAANNPPLMGTNVELEISLVIAKRRSPSVIDRKVNAAVDDL